MPASSLPPRASRSWTFLLRPLLVGLLFTPLCCYWSQDQVIDRIFSLMVPPVAITMLIALLNAPLAKRGSKFALSGGELMVVYALLAAACAMAGEWMDCIAPQVYGYAVFANQNSRMGDYMLPYLSKILFFTDPAPLKNLSNGTQTWRVFVSELPMWLPKVGMWTILFGLVSTAMLCINAMLRQQWIHRERLAFPIVQIPLALAQGTTGTALGATVPLWRQPLFLIGFALTFGIDTLNGLAFLYPQLPTINIRFLANANDWLTTPPWNQTGWIPIGLFPFMSAIGVFMPTDLLFSLLFFFFVRKAQQIVSYGLGNAQGTFGGGGLVPSPPYFSEQSWGAFLGLFVSAMWLARPHWKQVWNAITTGDDPEARDGAVPYRFTFILLLACIAGIGLFGLAIGLSLPWVLFSTLR